MPVLFKIKVSVKKQHCQAVYLNKVSMFPNEKELLIGFKVWFISATPTKKTAEFFGEKFEYTLI